MFRNEYLPTLDETDLLVILGGPMSVYDSKRYDWIEKERNLILKCKQLNKPVLGICLGAQQIAKTFDGDVVNKNVKEAGFFNVFSYKQSTFDFIPDTIKVFHWHQEEFIPPSGSLLLFKSKGCKHQGFIYNKNIIGLQFHLETTKQNIEEILKNDEDFLSEGEFVQNKVMIAKEDFDGENEKLLSDILDYLLQS